MKGTSFCKPIMISVTLFLGISACGPAPTASTGQSSQAITEMNLQRLAQREVRAFLKDSSSAEFRNQKRSCGEVNSKNSFGAFTGYQRFIAAKDLVVIERDSGFSQQEFQTMWDAFCK